MAEETSATADSEVSEAYEAHAVLLNLKRKQQDSTDAVIKIARREGNAELRDAATKMKRGIKAGADELGKSLADFAVQIAAPSKSGRSSTRARSASPSRTASLAKGRTMSMSRAGWQR